MDTFVLVWVKRTIRGLVEERDFTEGTNYIDVYATNGEYTLAQFIKEQLLDDGKWHLTLTTGDDVVIDLGDIYKIEETDNAVYNKIR